LDFYRTTYRSAFITAPAELLRIVIAAPNIANLETVVEVRGWLAGGVRVRTRVLTTWLGPR